MDHSIPNIRQVSVKRCDEAVDYRISEAC
jgi:hypothetical protein